MYNIVLSMSLKCAVYGLCMTSEQDQLVFPFYIFFVRPWQWVVVGNQGFGRPTVRTRH